MTTTALIEPLASNDAPHTAPSAPHLIDSGGLVAGLPPLLSVVPQAGPPVFVYVSFGVVLLLLLVPPLTLLATLMGVALVVAAALVALVVLAGAIVAAPVLLVRRLRAHRLGHFSLPIPRIRSVKAHRV
jgi:hypothetical protein